MIQVYSPSNTDYEHNGDCVLWPSRCDFSAELNGAWSLQLEHPIDDDGRWNYIVENAVLKVPTWMSTKYQRYRIRVVEKTETMVTATAYPVFFDSRDDAYIFDIRITNKSASAALNLLKAAAPAKYSVSTDVPAVESEVFQNCNLLEALTGKFRERWGGEILYNNNQFIINQRIGGDYGVTVEYGKNITGTTYNIDMTDVSTRLIPYAYNARQISGTTPWVDSPIINSYPKAFIRTVQFEDVKLAEDASDDDADDQSITICATQADLDTELRRLCNKMYADGADKPKISMSIDMLALEDTDEYAEFSQLEEIALGDTVHCKHSKLGIVSDARVVGIVWDCARDRIASVTLGDFAYDFLKDTGIDDILTSIDQMAQNFNSDGSIMAEKIKGLLNGMNVQLNAQYTAAKKQDVMAILFENLDPQSPLYGALGIGTQGLQISRQRSQDGKSWVWTTAATAKGVVADTVVTGTLADQAAFSFWDLVTGAMKVGGTITVSAGGVVEITAKDTNGNETFYLNSGTGVVRMNVTAFSLSGQTIPDMASSAANTAVNNAFDNYDPADELSQQEIFNLLTGGTKSSPGPAQGIWMKDGRVYLRWTYAEGGELKLGGSGNGNGELKLYSAAGAEMASINNAGAEFFEALGDMFHVYRSKINGGRLRFQVRRNENSQTYTVGDIIPWMLYSNNTWTYYLSFCTPQKGFKFQKLSGNTYADLFEILDDGIWFHKNVKSSLDVDGAFNANAAATFNSGLTSNGMVWSSGEVYSQSAVYGTQFIPTSDRRLKGNIKPSDADIIMELNVVSFDWKKTGEHVSAGMIAQEVERVCPELVKKNPEGYKGLDYTGLVPHLVKKVQEQERRLQDLEARIAALERR